VAVGELIRGDFGSVLVLMSEAEEFAVEGAIDGLFAFGAAADGADVGFHAGAGALRFADTADRTSHDLQYRKWIIEGGLCARTSLSK